ncbi:N-acetylglucosamine-binding protein GbpA [Pseudomonas sp. H11T01]|uniref:N-acetylglucosamine-binding protein GbpA n=1 Tax=Pseudomonas sp. H11T01 TaxID=3402749 RepID=UPI003AD68299
MKKTFSKGGALTGCASSLTLLAAMLTSQNVAAHGYLNEPPSRAFLCQKGLNKDCGGAQYEPQSVGETFKGFPAGVGGAPLQGPVDGKIASGGIGLFSAVDAQSATRWHLTEIKDRNINFDWKYTAVHPATKHEYFITKNGWNPNEPLKRASFDSTPFCFVDGGNILPVSGDKHACAIPEDKSGHHVILGVWAVGDTDAAFYNVVDVNILAEAALPGGWNSVGSIAPAATLLAGDKVKARAFTATGESAQYSVAISIDNAEEGKPENWSFKLAEQVNKTQKLVRAGMRDEQDNIEPVKGTNKLYAQKESGVIRYEVTLDMPGDPDARMVISAMPDEGFKLENGSGKVSFPVLTNRKLNVEATVYNDKNKPVGITTQVVDSNSTWINVDVRTLPGTHQVKLIGTTEDGRTTLQDLKTTEMTGEGGGEFDFQFPEGIEQYTAGTKVLQPKDGLVYECKPFPESGYCKQYSPTANGFEPGVGGHWHMAWDQK